MTSYTLPRPPASVAFGGETYDPPRDYERLTGQLGAVFDLMKDGRWRTLSEIAERVHGSEAGISARLRDLRKREYGGHAVERDNIGGGTCTYRLILNRSKS